ncbi:post-GPI attachment to proteins factor 3-like [Rhopilema esculentum]|uniref:post-GPI attachment to proteins factor 3-like n=1 Tax=Rhopilema esculentum TaxID=499914 RepID=UPI0031DCBFC9
MNLLRGILCLFASYIPLALGSYGDRHYSFQSCLSSNKPRCNEQGYPAILPWYLRIFGWQCLDELKYQCMHKTTEMILEKNGPVFQYYGKWPFVRFLGIQEPASTLFSIGNLLAHVLGWGKFSKSVEKHYILYESSRLYFVLSINAWFWSSVFHTKDTNFTEKMDYFCATLAVMSSILFCFIRIIGRQTDQRCILFASGLALLYAYHIYTMGYIKFDYGYNMKFNVFIGTTNAIMWLIWCFVKRKERPYVWRCALVVSSVYLCVGLELFDFPPLWWTFDAHSLWHLATIPFCYFWYSFLIEDGKYEASLVKRL